MNFMVNTLKSMLCEQIWIINNLPAYMVGRSSGDAFFTKQQGRALYLIKKQHLCHSLINVKKAQDAIIHNFTSIYTSPFICVYYNAYMPPHEHASTNNIHIIHGQTVISTNDKIWDIEYNLPPTPINALCRLKK